MNLYMKVAAGLGAVGLALYLVAPNVAYASLPLLILAACPLSMVFMMKTMSGGKKEDPTPESAGPGGAHDSDELAGLRTEVDRLRAESANPGGNGSTHAEADNSSQRQNR